MKVLCEAGEELWGEDDGWVWGFEEAVVRVKFAVPAGEPERLSVQEEFDVGLGVEFGVSSGGVQTRVGAVLQVGSVLLMEAEAQVEDEVRVREGGQIQLKEQGSAWEVGSLGGSRQGPDVV